LLLQHLFQQWDTSLGKGKYSISKTFNCKLSLIQEQSIASVLAMASLQKGTILLDKKKQQCWKPETKSTKQTINKPEKKREDLIGKFKLNEQADVHVLLNVHWTLSTQDLHVLPSSNYTLVTTSQILPTWDRNPIRSIYEKANNLSLPYSRGSRYE
jgi:hypothetical protein